MTFVISQLVVFESRDKADLGLIVPLKFLFEFVNQICNQNFCF